MVFSIWKANIYIAILYGKYKKGSRVLFLVKSFLFVGLFVFAMIVVFHFLRLEREPSQLIFMGINVAGVNAVILSILGLVIFQTNEVRVREELADLKVKNLEAEQKHLIDQLQPHFLFNALSVLKSLIRTDAELAEEYLVRLSDFLRVTVSRHRNALIPLKDELAFTDDYVELQAIRFGGSFTCSMQIPQEVVSAFRIPVYALQTLVENTIKHNAFTQERPLKVEVVFEDGYLTITNNKVPKLVTATAGLGLENLSKRYLLICHEDIKVHDTSDYFSVTIKLIAN
ncbi:MAG: histidine kinase [Breznakibacter sp.]